jgi:hypothetical protein
MFRIVATAKQFREYVLLRDGQGLARRTATTADLPAIRELLGRISGQSLRMRFMGTMAQAPVNFVDGLCSADPRARRCARSRASSLFAGSITLLCGPQSA